nr:hypothetical protein [Tanacetum cinerariifolium]
MDLFAFIRHSDPTKVRIGERYLAEREDTGAKGASEVFVEKTKKKRKRKDVGDASGPTFPPKKLREDYHAGAFDTGGKSLAIIRELDDGPTDFVSGPNLRTCPPFLRYVVSSDDSHRSRLLQILPLRVGLMQLPLLYFEFNVGAARQVCLGLEVRMRAKHTLERKGELEDKCVEQAAFLSDRDAEIVHLKSLLSLKEAEVVEAIRLCSQLTIVEAADVAKGGELRDLKEKNFALEGERDVMSEKIANLESANDAKVVASLESERDCIVTQDEQAKILGDRVAELDAQLSKMAIHLDEEFYPRFLTTISGRRWFLTHRLKLVLLKCLQSSEYLQALGQAIGYAVNKGIQGELKARIDHGTHALLILWILSAWRVLLAKIPGAKNLQPSREQLMLPIHRLEDDVVIRETSLSSSLQVVYLQVQRFRGEVKEKRLLYTDVITPLVEPLSSKSLTSEASTSDAPITTLSTTFAFSDVVLLTSVVTDQVLDAEPHNEDPSAVTFEKEELGTSPEYFNNLCVLLV